TASCYRGTEKVGGDLALTIGDDGRSDRKHRPNQDDPVKISPRWNPERALTIQSWNMSHTVTFTCADGGDTTEPKSTTFYQVPSRPLMEFPGRSFITASANELPASSARNLHVHGTEFRDGNVTCGYFDDGRFPSVKLSENPPIIRIERTKPDSNSPVSTEPIDTVYRCLPPGGGNAALIINTYVVKHPLPVLTGLEGAGDEPHANDAVYNNPVSCEGIFGGLLENERRRGNTVPDLGATATGPGGVYELNSDLGIDAGATPGDYTISLECTQMFLRRTLDAEPASFTVTITEPATSTPAATVLEGAASDARIKDAASYTHTLVCKEDGVEVGSDRILFHPRLEDLPPNEDTSVEIYCRDTGGRTSEQSNRTVSIHLDTVPPVITPATGTLNLELGEAFTEESACTDTNPDVTIASVPTTGVGEVRAALLSKAQNTVGLIVTYDCTDEAGNNAVQSVRTFPILDTTNPAPPTVTERTITVGTGESIDYGASCAQDAGTPIQLVNSTVDSDNNPVHVIDTRSAGTYEITYKCRDGANLESATAAQTVRVEASTTTTPAAKPVLTLATTTKHLMPGQTYVPELTCTLNDIPVNSDIISSDTGISDLVDDVQTVTAPLDEGRSEVTYTCTSGGETADNRPVLVIISDGTDPVIKLLNNTSVGRVLQMNFTHHLQPVPGQTYDSVDPTARCTDAPPGMLREMLASNASDASLGTDERFTIEYRCGDLAGNNVTAYRSVTVDGTGPAIRGVPAGNTIPHDAAYDPAAQGATCVQDAGVPVVPAPSITVTGPDTEITSSSPPGDYEITYLCADTLGNEGEPATQMITKSAAPAAGPLLSDPDDDVAYLRYATTYVHGITCMEGGADRTGEIKFDPALETLEAEGTYGTTLYCPATSG
ncbi:MAG: hypothetical protein MPJ07_08495, partial [Nitrosopumilus sp.]|nr:hypothetical protein [Nitrosopumilus sp.]